MKSHRVKILALNVMLSRIACSMVLWHQLPERLSLTRILSSQLRLRYVPSSNCRLVRATASLIDTSPSITEDSILLPHNTLHGHGLPTRSRLAIPRTTLRAASPHLLHPARPSRKMGNATLSQLRTGRTQHTKRIHATIASWSPPIREESLCLRKLRT